jgi:protein SCO1/2/putative membrane protein
VFRPYRLGVRITLGTILISAGVCLIAVDRSPPFARRAAHDLGAAATSLGAFRLQERSGHTVTNDDLADRVAIVAFIFTRCPLSCPRISGVMRGLQERLAGTDVLLVSLTVDPDHDTRAVLSAYARRFRASPDRWWFLTGPKATIYALIQDRFKLSVMEQAAADPAMGVESIAHSDRLALVDRGRIIGLFESDDPAVVEALARQASRRALPSWVRLLPTFNAGLNGLSASLLMAGWISIRRYRLSGGKPLGPVETTLPGAIPWNERLVKSHVTCMVSAFATSTVFLVCYLLYHYQAGSVPFAHGGAIRVVYFTILLSHTVLAAISVPLILTTLVTGLRGNLARHTRIAPVTFPIWLYVSITGIVVYVMLYGAPLFGSFDGFKACVYCAAGGVRPAIQLEQSRTGPIRRGTLDLRSRTRPPRIPAG